MGNTLLLNAGASWAAYQIGAIEHLVEELGLEFDSYLGCGIGAMNAALLACGEYDALIRFWDSISARRLIRPNVTSPWKALARNTPQRHFVEEHVHERALIERGTTLSFTTFDLLTGDEIVHRFPGDEVPIVDALMAAVATPGLLAPLRAGARMLAEATLIDSVPFAAIRQNEVPQRVVGILAGMPLDGHAPNRLTTWRAVGARSLEINLANDARRAIETSRRAASWRQDSAALRAELLALAPQSATAQFDAATKPLEGVDPPSYVWITPSEPLGYPLWRFPRQKMHAARLLGRHDAGMAAL